MTPIRSSPRLRLLLGCVLISFSSVFAKLSSVGPTSSAFYRVAIGGAVLALLVLLAKAKLSRSPAPLLLLAGAALFFALDLGFWHRSILAIGPGLSTLLASLQVFFMAAAGFVFLGQKPARNQILAIPLAIAGLACIVGLDWSILSAEYRTGVLLGLLTAMTYAGYMMTLRQAQAPDSKRLPIAELALVSLLSALLLGGTALVEGQSLAITKGIDYVWLGCLGVLCHVCGWLCIAGSLPKLSPAVAGLTLTLQPVLTFVWDIVIFGRGVTAIEAVGGLVTVFAIYLGSRRR